MDTRSKIISVSEALEISKSSQLTIATGYFDPLLAENAARVSALAAANTRLLVIVTDPADPLMPARARLELVAALRAVDYVVHLSERQVLSCIASLHPSGVFRGEEEDQNLRQTLVALIRSRAALA